MTKGGEKQNGYGRVLVVGGGAAGILAAISAADAGARVTVLEKKDRLGLKILISGGGKCNLTHAGSMDSIRRAFRPNEGRFLLPSFYRFTNEDFLDLLRDRGMQVYTRPDGRIFPVDANAKDVVAILERHLRDRGIRIQFNTPVTGLRVENGELAGVETEGGFFPARHAIVCVGGSSYPATGCTGDGWKWMREIGHRVERLYAALAPMYLEWEQPREWAGVALRDVVLKGRIAGKEVMRWRGDLLFTHKGISGPTALGVSREIAEAWGTGEPTVEVDILPDRSFEQLQTEFRQLAGQHPRRMVPSLIEEYLPERLVEPVLESAGVKPDTRLAYLPAKGLNALVNTLKGWKLKQVRHVPLEKGEVVAGGVNLEEVDPKTMRSKRVKGLYLAGEVLDIAGPVGGYNLQAAWSTGFVAGETAAHDALAETELLEESGT